MPVHGQQAGKAGKTSLYSSKDQVVRKLAMLLLIAWARWPASVFKCLGTVFESAAKQLLHGTERNLTRWDRTEPETMGKNGT